MPRRNDPELRAMIAHEAARLMYDEGVEQYMDAKRLAAKRVLGARHGRRVHFRPQALPSNGEIREALLELAMACEGPDREARLFAMRVTALEAMRALKGFHPRLIGSVSTGHVRRGSDIDVHVFTDALDPLEDRLHALGWVWDTNKVTIRVGNGFREYTHVHVLDCVFPLELSVYPTQERRVTSRSSTDGKNIIRVKPAALEALLSREHPERWARYQDTGVVADLDLFVEEAEQPYLTLADIDAAQR